MYKVLLVDDEGIVLDSLRFIINKNFGESCDIRTAKTGRQALRDCPGIRTGYRIHGYSDAWY